MKPATKTYDFNRTARAHYEPVELTPQQHKEWDTTRSAFVWQQPAFTHLLLSMLNPHGSKLIALFTKGVPIAATDGTQMILNPDTFFKYTLPERVFILAHEVMHCVFDHVGLAYGMGRRGKVVTTAGKSYEYHSDLMNIATDLVINDLLIESKVGSYNKDWLHDTNYGTHKDSAVDVYEKLFQQAKKNGGGGGPSGKGFDELLAPGAGDGKDPDQTQQQRSAQEWKTAVAAAAAAAKAQGKLPSALEALFGQILDPQVPWQEKIQSFFARKVGSGSTDWRRADRRLIVRDIYSPGRSGFGAGTVVIGFDTSGSIYADRTLLDRFIAEVGGILDDVRPRRLVIVWCDAKVHRTDEVDELTDLQGLRPVGGGGTDFRPVFDWVTEQGIEPDCLVFLTDGYGTFPPSPPAFPVLWGDISDKADLYPWGDVVSIPKAS